MQSVTPHKNRDSLYTQLADLQEQRRGISKKLALYQTITLEIEKLKIELGDQDSHAHPPLSQSTSGAALRYPTRDTRTANLCNHAQYSCRGKTSKGINCTEPVKLAGVCRKCAHQKYRTYCTNHGARS